MGKIKTFFRLLKNDRQSLKRTMFAYWSRSSFSHLVSDERYLKKQYKTYIGKSLNLENPKSFNEKLQWLKLYDRKPEYTIMVDKYLVRDYIAKQIGEEYLIPLLGVWDRADDIDFDALPEQFVLKCNHDSGNVFICKDKQNFPKNEIKKKLKKALKKNLFWWGREWPYKNVPRKMIAEKYMVDESGYELKDYKFMCFNGEVKCSFICSNRYSKGGLHVTFFDRDWNVMPFERHYPAVKEGLPKPVNYDKMIELAEKLSKNIPFLRVDFYEVDGKIYFGELTFYPGNGMEEFTPEEWDYKLGEWIKLPEVKEKI